MNAAAVAGGRLAAGGPVVAADGDHPVLARCVLLQKDVRSDGEIAVRIEQVAGMLVAVRVIAEVHLPEARVDAAGGCVCKRSTQPGAGFGPCGIALRMAGDVEGPRPRNQAAVQP